MARSPVWPPAGDRLRMWRGKPVPMAKFHAHDEVEINIVVRGSLDYLVGGDQYVVPEGHVALFWAAAPHRMVGPEPTDDDDIAWVNVPLPTILRWSLPSTFASVVLAQRIVVVPLETVGPHVLRLLTSWQRDLETTEEPEAVWYEAAALVTRILAAHERQGTTPSGATKRPSGAPSSAPDSRVAAMARHIAEHFREPIGTAEIARVAGLTPGYATTLFRRSIGLTLGEQLVRHRVAEAQRLLITTTMTTESIAHAAGFGSSSSFYDHFVQSCGVTPGAYRSRTASPRTSGPADRASPPPQ